MNQRQKRARDRRRSDQNIGSSVMSTGGHLASHSRGAAPVVRTPQKATGDVPGSKAKGIAKASPMFKKLKEVVTPKTKKEEQRVIAKATEKKVEKQEDIK